MLRCVSRVDTSVSDIGVHDGFALRAFVRKQAGFAVLARLAITRGAEVGDVVVHVPNVAGATSFADSLTSLFFSCLYFCPTCIERDLRATFSLLFLVFLPPAVRCHTKTA